MVDTDRNLEYMIQNQIHSYMSNSSGLNVGMGKPLTQAEYEEMRRMEKRAGNVHSPTVVSNGQVQPM